jgi:hypothetical protein
VIIIEFIKCRHIVKYNIILDKPKPPLRDEGDVTMAPALPTTLPPMLSPNEINTQRTAPVGLCALPENPREDPDVNKNSGYRFGMLYSS